MVAGAPDATVKRMRLPRRTALPARQCPGELAYYPYLLGGLAIEWVNQVWCADVTYIPMAKRFLYLVVIMDWMSRAATFEHARCRLLCIRPISDAFIMLIRSVVPLIIFATVAVGIAKTGDMRRVGVVRLRAIIYFEVVSSLALLVGLTGRQSAVARRRPPYHSNPAGRLHYFRTDSVTDAEFMLLVGTSNGKDIRFQPA